MKFLLQHLLTASASKFPDKKAVVYGDEAITYEELDIASSQLANCLIDQGVQRGDRVGIFINKSIPSLVTIYGILKADAVYVPLDPQAPLDRIGFIIDNCGINCVVTSTAKSQAMSELHQQTESLKTAIFSDEQKPLEDMALNAVSWAEVRTYNSSVPQTKAIHNDLAYIIYTSGSTGLPKGVMISHLNSLTFVNWAADQLEVNTDDVFSSHAPLHFDLSIFDVFVCAKVGGTLVLVPETMSMFPPRLSQWIEKNEISVWYSVPSILSMMVSHGQLAKRDFKKLRKIIFAGEVFPIKYLRTLMNTIPQAQYINLYGPTETNVITYQIAEPIPDDQTEPIPIGVCCENMEVFAVTKDGKLVTKPGEEGELMARGTCVAQGYWGDSEKTNKVFVKNPFQKDFADRMYKTGDLVTLNEQGAYIYKGRVDHMIKSRGYRIEIGEIETAVYTHPAIKEAAIIAIPDDLITNRIKAVIALADDQELDAAGLRSHCAAKLPKYMVPELIEFMNELPKTSTGKINKPLLIKQTLESSSKAE